MWSWLRKKKSKGEATVTDEELVECDDMHDLLVSKGLPVVVVKNVLGKPLFIGVKDGYMLSTARDVKARTTVYYWEKI